MRSWRSLSDVVHLSLGADRPSKTTLNSPEGRLPPLHYVQIRRHFAAISLVLKLVGYDPSLRSTLDQLLQFLEGWIAADCRNCCRCLWLYPDVPYLMRDCSDFLPVKKSGLEPWKSNCRHCRPHCVQVVKMGCSLRGSDHTFKRRRQEYHTEFRFQVVLSRVLAQMKHHYSLIALSLSLFYF